VRVLRAGGARIYRTRFSPDGHLVAAVGDEGVVQVWDVRSGALVHELRGHRGRVRDCDFSADGSLLATVGHDRTLCVWSVSAGHRTAVLGAPEALTGVTFRPGSTSLAVGDALGVLLLVDLVSGPP
jgi:WD40 repeat protein